MNFLSESLLEYPVAMEVFDVGHSLGPQHMAEIGDLRRFHYKKARVAFARIDARSTCPADGHPQMQHLQTYSPVLRRTLFLVMSVILQSSPADKLVFQFTDKKRSEGKPYWST